MKATVIAIRSGHEFTDKKRRVRIRLEEAEFAYRDIELTEDALGCVAVHLDDELEIEVHPLTMHARQRAAVGGTVAGATAAGEMVIMEPREPGKDGLL